ncbi:alpha/beta hydrolase family protein [Pseudomonas sp. TTU2014-080ASC]|uniref:alpha/beta hydrolase family protein n=1 Tax=Pseudomonas sp. TTU2014-080ASC TaxID=1729724 RepID=UPI00071834F4|nr:S9 family peptidase [Pseudomonas sp. TTU2014-080ASC]KRW59740.1 peptidase S9 [Pseudomonas sp. TTU2014-080ASC]
MTAGKKQTAPYGHWLSDWSSADAASASRDFAELRAGLGGLVWSLFDPADASTRLWHWTPQQLVCLTPDPYSVRSRVYEYGGGAFCLADDGLAWVCEADQQIYWQSMDGAICPLTQRPACRYGDLVYDPFRRAVLAVEESREDDAVIHRLVAISRIDCQRAVVAQGADFYAAPTLSGDGQRLAWIEWCRPYQPWLATRLYVAQWQAEGCWAAPVLVAGKGDDESIQQPAFDAQQRMLALSDKNGYWQPWRETQAGSNVLEPLNSRATDHAGAPWQLGARNYQVLERSLLLSGFDAGFLWLAEREPESGREHRLANEYSRFRQLAADDRYFYAIAASPTTGSEVLAIDRASHEVKVLASVGCNLPAEEVSQPQRMLYLSGTGESSHGFFYAPNNSGYQAPEGERPPLVIFLHGGPTSACYPVFDPRIQFWTQRGFAVADINYRGSSGFGRAYRLRLQGCWGQVDVEDAQAAVRHLAQAGLIDPQRAFIRGGSAGGYTALCALAFTEAFCGGASLYGVSDPLSLRRVTHKFEADYLDWLIGDPERDAARYQARTPLLHAASISVPVIFFQGALDAVVLPEQTAQMVTELKRQGVEVACHVYAQERHGFRQAENLAAALAAELAFYQRLL